MLIEITFLKIIKYFWIIINIKSKLRLEEMNFRA